MSEIDVLLATLTSRRLARLSRRLRLAIELARAGVTAPVPLLLAEMGRRRKARLCRLPLEDGLTLVAPRAEPLVEMLAETWLERRYLPPGIPSPTTIVDIGAHVGIFSIWAASRFPEARILAVEPATETFGCLKLNVERNNLANVEPVQAAVGGRARRTTLYRRGFAAANTLYTHDNYGSRFEPLESVEVVPLDELFARSSVCGCDLLKLDCEGAEYELLLGASERVLRRIHGFAIEYHLGLTEHAPGELQELLERLGHTVRMTPVEDVEAGGYLYAVR